MKMLFLIWKNNFFFFFSFFINFIILNFFIFKSGGKNASSLRYLSIIMRAIPNQNQRAENVQKSVELSKDAVRIDMKDG
jgi:hypothetical protein